MYEINVATANFGLDYAKKNPESMFLVFKGYGDFAPEPSKHDFNHAINRKYIDELHASLRISSGEITISLREELVRTKSAQTAQLKLRSETEIKDKLAVQNQKVEAHISELSNAAYTLAIIFQLMR